MIKKMKKWSTIVDLTLSKCDHKFLHFLLQVYNYTLYAMLNSMISPWMLPKFNNSDFVIIIIIIIIILLLLLLLFYLLFSLVIVFSFLWIVFVNSKGIMSSQQKCCRQYPLLPQNYIDGTHFKQCENTNKSQFKFF